MSMESEKQAFERLIEACRRSNPREEEVKYRVRRWIESILPEAKASFAEPVPTGEIDLLINNNVIVETKIEEARIGIAPGRLRSDQRQRRKFAASQLQDYVNAKYEGVAAPGREYIGYTTNGKVWEKYAVSVGGEMPTILDQWRLDQRLLSEGSEDADDLEDVKDALLNDLASALSEQPTPPEDLAELLAGYPVKAGSLAKSLRGKPELETKLKVWEDLMHGASVALPPDEETRLRLFASHSVLVEFARGVVNKVTKRNERPQRANSHTFSNWVGILGKETASLQQQIASEVDTFDWRESGVDILKNVYHDFIPPSVRHDFGEYYTPDWLAEAVCEHVVDDAWCRDAIERAADPEDDLRGCGIFEPACGSGTFLRAAVNRLKPFAARAIANQTAQADAISRLIFGLDLHPVAVELAKATFLSSLPEAPTNGIASANIWLADSLRWVVDTDMRLFAQGGILVNVPSVSGFDDIDLTVPGEIIGHADFNAIVNELFEFQNDSEFLAKRLDRFDLGTDAVSAAVELSESLRDLADQGRDHVWRWYLLNVAQAHILHRRGFDRIVGNPPWVTRKDLAADRKDRHRDESKRIGVWAGGARLATQNNLAALFVAAVTSDYAASNRTWKAGFVLPWSALGADAWAPFRTGSWDENAGGGSASIDFGEPPWDLEKLSDRPFPQSDSCVIFGRSPIPRSAPLPAERIIWRGDGITNAMRWEDVAARVIRTVEIPPARKASRYLDLVRNGATLFPKGLIRVDPSTIRKLGNDNVMVSNFPSKKGKWRGVQKVRSVVESSCVQPALFSDDILPFRIGAPSKVVIPLKAAIKAEDFESEIAQLEHFGKHWFDADSTYRAIRSDRDPGTLLDRIDHLGGLSAQTNGSKRFRLVYPKSGELLFGVVTTRRMLVDNACYYIDFETVEEALYVCALLGADCLQHSYQRSRPTDRHFDTYPLRSIPIPQFDFRNADHLALTTLARRAMRVAKEVELTGGTPTRRKAVREELRMNGVMTAIDDVVKNVLPHYCE